MNLIAEIGSNHNQSTDRITKLIQSAKDCGFTSIKFQKFKVEKLWHNKDLQKKVKKQELSNELFDHAYNEAKRIGIKIGCSVFDYESLEYVKDKCDFFKISSFDILRHDFILTILKQHRPVIISLGMANDKHLFDIYPMLRSYLHLVQFTHCVSKYPTLPIECNLQKITSIYDRFKIRVGWSDHTVNQNVIFGAISQGANLLELHFDLDDRNGFETCHGHCWTESQAKELIKNIGEYEVSIIDNNIETIDSKLYADPSDGVRPLKEYR